MDVIPSESPRITVQQPDDNNERDGISSSSQDSFLYSTAPMDVIPSESPRITVQHPDDNERDGISSSSQDTSFLYSTAPMDVIPSESPSITVQQPDDNNERDDISSSSQDSFLYAKTRALPHGLRPKESDRSMDWENLVVSTATPMELSSDIVLETGHQVNSVCARLIKIFRDSKKYEKFLAYRDEPAKDLLDLLQKLLDHASLESRFRVILYVALVRLCRKSEFCPRCFSLTGVHVESDIPLSYGAFGDIYKGKYNGKTVCLKAVRLLQTSNRPALEKAYSREAVVWGQLSHPNILPFYGIHRIDDHNKLCLVSPWMENGNIREFLSNPARSQLDRTPLISDIASGMKYLHDNGVVHGDLKSLNILVTESERACLADFGFSYVAESGGLGGLALSSHHVEGGTRGFEAPELAISDDLKRTSASDVFAFAMVCFEVGLPDSLPAAEGDSYAAQVFTGEIPFGGRRATPFKIQSGERPERITSQLHVQRGLTDTMWALMEKCWSQSPEIRPTAARILEVLPRVEPDLHESWEWMRTQASGFEISDGQVDPTITNALSHLQPLS